MLKSDVLLTQPPTPTSSLRGLVVTWLPSLLPSRLLRQLQCDLPPTQNICLLRPLSEQDYYHWRRTGTSSGLIFDGFLFVWLLNFFFFFLKSSFRKNPLIFSLEKQTPKPLFLSIIVLHTDAGYSCLTCFMENCAACEIKTRAKAATPGLISCNIQYG